jgi:hypothetical protein
MKCLWILIYAPHLNNEKLEGKNIYVWPESKDYNKGPHLSVMDIFPLIQRYTLTQSLTIDGESKKNDQRTLYFKEVVINISRKIRVIDH